MTVTEGIFLALAAAFAAVTMAPFLRCKKWWIRGWEFPRAQIAVLAAIAILAGVHQLDPTRPIGAISLGVIAAALAWQLFRILPYTRLWRREVKSAQGRRRGERIKLLISNVEMSNRDSPKLLALVEAHDPDVVLTLESDKWWEEQLKPAAVARPHQVLHPLDNTYGMHLYSRLPLRDATVKHLIEENVPSMHMRAVLGSGEEVFLHCMHPSPPSPTQHEESTQRDAELALLARKCAGRSAPTIVIGDLNDVAWSHTTRAFRRVSGLKDPRRGRGMFNSFHARVPIMRWPLDHVFHSGHFTLVGMSRLSYVGSDHFPILVELERIPVRTRVKTK